MVGRRPPQKTSLVRARRHPMTRWTLHEIANEGGQMSTSTQNNLEGQRALVTVATRGIGRAVALQLARDGAEVLVHGRNAARGAETIKEIEAAGGKASFVAADLADAADVQWLPRAVGEGATPIKQTPLYPF